MGFYGEQVVPRVLDKMLASDEIMGWRSRCVEGLHGVVVEPGFGSGLNIEVYPSAVTKVYAIDPSAVGQKLAAERMTASSVDIEYVGSDGQELPLDDASCDNGLTTYTLCTIPDAQRALSELHRVIKPGGKLHFLEHGHSPDEGVQRWQRRLEPVQRRVFDGCHLTRHVPSVIESGGFRIEQVDADYIRGPKPLTWTSVGRAERLDTA